MEKRIEEAHRTQSQESIAALVRQAIAEARELARLEVALAKQEVLRELSAGKKAGASFGVGTVLAISGFTMLLVAIALAFSPTWLPALLVGVIALCLAGLAGLLGYKAAPKRPLAEIRKRVETDVNLLKERTA